MNGDYAIDEDIESVIQMIGRPINERLSLVNLLKLRVLDLKDVSTGFLHQFPRLQHFSFKNQVSKEEFIILLHSLNQSQLKEIEFNYFRSYDEIDQTLEDDLEIQILFKIQDFNKLESISCNFIEPYEISDGKVYSVTNDIKKFFALDLPNLKNLELNFIPSNQFENLLEQFSKNKPVQQQRQRRIRRNRMNNLQSVMDSKIYKYIRLEVNQEQRSLEAQQKDIFVDFKKVLKYLNQTKLPKTLAIKGIEVLINDEIIEDLAQIDNHLIKYTTNKQDFKTLYDYMKQIQFRF
ncbi:UNKNOWN [Stylonychia lemnae]|uniref:Uncharacterized protein n=1 Tax=Stylonychia lemnae TaxID=5949 RepID=A0A078B917_STYLE|nr:UNKNOWN [Stylonychia lemnae]|eukprot:CDW91005.1 UNKNOWN [Stylonychia lemnae]